MQAKMQTGIKHDAEKLKLSLISPDMMYKLVSQYPNASHAAINFCYQVSRVAHASTLGEVLTHIDFAIEQAADAIGAEHALQFCGIGMQFGLEKYGKNNWKNGFEWSRLCDAALRHVALGVAKGEDLDPESGNPHWGHALCMLMFLLHSVHTKPELNDIY